MSDKIQVDIVAADKFTTTFSKLNTTAAQSQTKIQSLTASISRMAGAIGGTSLAIQVFKTGFKELVETQKTFFLLSKQMESFGVSSLQVVNRVQKGYEQVAQLTAQDANTITSIGIKLAQQTGLAHSQIQELMLGMRGLSLTTGSELESIASAIAAAMNGRTMELKRLGIEIDNNATKQQKYNALVEQLGKHQQTAIEYTDTLAGRMDKLTETAKSLSLMAVQAWQDLGNLLVHGKTQKEIDKETAAYSAANERAKAFSEARRRGLAGKGEDIQWMQLIASAATNTQLGQLKDEYLARRAPVVGRSSAGAEFDSLMKKVDEIIAELEKQKQAEIELQQKKEDLENRANNIVSDILSARQEEYELIDKQNERDKKILDQAIAIYNAKEKEKERIEKQLSQEAKSLESQQAALQVEYINIQKDKIEASKALAEAEKRLQELIANEVKEKEQQQREAYARTRSKSEQKRIERYERWSDEARARGNIVQAEKYAAKAYDTKYGKGAYEKKLVEEENARLNERASAKGAVKDIQKELADLDAKGKAVVDGIKEIGKRFEEINKALEAIKKGSK